MTNRPVGIDEESGASRLQAGLLEHRTDHFLDDGAPQRRLAQLTRAVPLGVLSGNHHGTHPDGAIALVLHRHLALAVGAEPCDGRVAVCALPNRGEALGNPVRQHDGQRHPLAGFIAGVSEHHALVAGALLGPLVAVDTLRDVRRLTIDRGQHRAGAAIEAERGVGVADAGHRLAHEIGNVDVRAGGDLAGHHRHPGGHQRFTSHARVGVAGDDRIENGVGDLVGNLVGMPFGYRLGGEDVPCGGGHNSPGMR